MDALTLFHLRYDAIHAGFADDLFKGLTDAQVRTRPHGLNSIVWLAWHAMRIEDAAVSRFVADRPQVLDEGGWRDRLGVDRPDVGSGMSTVEAEALSARIDAAAKFIDLDNLCLSPQCGFASTEEGNLLTEDEQWAKLGWVVDVAREIWPDA